ncbi:unnamed protein product [Cuscuta campestris]|uniref:Uncharacterized protein n=1 Tax=Cuscuta campestris TaxID=132261 RepID=A0A484L2U8_9ASTE|nr:unnamed protein product [Cuscuta campestris]
MMALPMDSNTPMVTPAPMDTSTSHTPHATALRQYPYAAEDDLKQVDEQSEAKGITSCFYFNTTKDIKDEHSTPDLEVGSVAPQYELENLTKEADLKHTHEQSIEERMDGMSAQNANYVGNAINLDDFPELTRHNLEEDVDTPTKKDDTTGTDTDG